MTSTEILTLPVHTYSDQLADYNNALNIEGANWQIESLSLDQTALPKSGFMVRQTDDGKHISLWEYVKTVSGGWQKTYIFLADSEQGNYRRANSGYSYAKEREQGFPVHYSPDADKLIPITSNHAGQWTKYFPVLSEGPHLDLRSVFTYLVKHNLNLPIIGIREKTGTLIGVHLRPKYLDRPQPVDYVIELGRERSAMDITRLAVMLSQPLFLQKMLDSELKFLEYNLQELKLKKFQRERQESAKSLKESQKYIRNDIAKLQQKLELSHWLIEDGYMIPRKKLP